MSLRLSGPIEEAYSRGGQDKMFTMGAGGGVATVGAGWHGEPLILVEGIFDALSLAVCCWDCVATIGRWAPWLPEVCAGRTVWLAFDANAPGEVRHHVAVNLTGLSMEIRRRPATLNPTRYRSPVHWPFAGVGGCRERFV
jgi:hypothetical protein